MPWIEIDEADQEVQANSTSSTHDQIGEDIIAETEGCIVDELADDDVHGGEGSVGHYDAVE